MPEDSEGGGEGEGGRRGGGAGEGSGGLVVLLYFMLLTSRGQRYLDASLLSMCSPTKAV